MGRVASDELVGEEGVGQGGGRLRRPVGRLETGWR